MSLGLTRRKKERASTQQWGQMWKRFLVLGDQCGMAVYSEGSPSLPACISKGYPWKVSKLNFGALAAVLVPS